MPVLHQIDAAYPSYTNRSPQTVQYVEHNEDKRREAPIPLHAEMHPKGIYFLEAGSLVTNSTVASGWIIALFRSIHHQPSNSHRRTIAHLLCRVALRKAFQIHGYIAIGNGDTRSLHRVFARINFRNTLRHGAYLLVFK